MIHASTQKRGEPSGVQAFKRTPNMKTDQRAPRNIDEYIAGFPDDVQKTLKKIRLTIRRAAPDAQEAIKYQMPAFTLNGNLLFFAAHKRHIGFYPAPAGNEKLKNELSAYRSGRSTLRFPLYEPIPFDLIAKIVKFLVNERLKRVDAKAKKT
jgi:uncharacterized protein YdhG (YjbR/CyaY superfamily)